MMYYQLGKLGVDAFSLRAHFEIPGVHPLPLLCRPCARRWRGAWVSWLIVLVLIGILTRIPTGLGSRPRAALVHGDFAVFPFLVEAKLLDEHARKCGL